MILHIFKMLHGLAPNDLGLCFYTSARRGLCCKIPSITTTSSAKAQTLYDHSFHIIGAKLWNITPNYIRENKSFPSFKAALTKWMMTLQDHPPVPGIASQNCLIDVVLASGGSAKGPVEDDDGWGKEALMVTS